jgi:putative ABC transport system ATP-binding protein
MNHPYLVLDRVTRMYGSGELAVPALVDASLTARRHELVAVMGPSGSGKSTLLNLAGALDTPTSGSVVIDGVDLTTCSAKELARIRRTKVGFVFQDFNLIPSLTAAENVFLPLELDGLSPRAARPLAERALAEVNLHGAADRFPDELSGGERQRVAIARVIDAAIAGETDAPLFEVAP